MGERRKKFVGLQLEDGACGEAFESVRNEKISWVT
jgi:hypothetical protein